MLNVIPLTLVLFVCRISDGLQGKCVVFCGVLYSVVCVALAVRYAGCQVSAESRSADNIAKKTYTWRLKPNLKKLGDSCATF